MCLRNFHRPRYEVFIFSQNGEIVTEIPNGKITVLQGGCYTIVTQHQSSSALVEKNNNVIYSSRFIVFNPQFKSKSNLFLLIVYPVNSSHACEFCTHVVAGSAILCHDSSRSYVFCHWITIFLYPSIELIEISTILNRCFTIF